MNKQLILKMITPYLKCKTITYDDFDILFRCLSNKEQYAVVCILIENGIELDDAKEFSNGNCSINVQTVNELFKDNHSKSNVSEEQMIYKNISQSNEILCKLIQQDNHQAKQDLCQKNERLVKKYAKKYQGYFDSKLDLEDLSQAGMIGLIKAAEKFNLARDVKFSTYAVYWIKQAIFREIMDTGYTIRIPVHMAEQIIKITLAECKYICIPLSERIQKLSEDLELTEQDIKKILRIRDSYLNVRSLNLPVGEDTSTELYELITDEKTDLTENLALQDDLKEQIKNILATLKPKEERVLRLRFGLDDGITKTLEEIGQIMGVTRERIRQIEGKALKKLRRPAKVNKLEVFL